MYGIKYGDEVKEHDSHSATQPQVCVGFVEQVYNGINTSVFLVGKLGQGSPSP